MKPNSQAAKVLKETMTSMEEIERLFTEGVIMWHYFVEDIYFSEYGRQETSPYAVTINVKEKVNGEYVYSFNAEKESSTRRTLHADVNTRKGANGELFLDNSIPQPSDSVNNKFSISDENVSDDTAEAPESAPDTNVGDKGHLTRDEPYGTAITGSSFRPTGAGRGFFCTNFPKPLAI